MSLQTVEISDGRRVGLEIVRIEETYGFGFNGAPGPRVHRLLIRSLESSAARVVGDWPLVIAPPPEYVDVSEFIQADRWPRYFFAGLFISQFFSDDPIEFWSLGIAWFQDVTTPLVDDLALSSIARVDWYKHALLRDMT